MYKRLSELTYEQKVELALRENFSIRMCERYGIDVRDVVILGNRLKTSH
jgi:hypothetical protein